MSEADRERWNRRYKERTDFLDFNPHALLVDHLYLLTGGRALDLACGVGRDALFLAAQGYRVDAVDLSRVALRMARAEAKRRNLSIQFIEADLDNYAIKPETYDLIVDFYFLDRRLMPQMRAGLKRGGLVFLETYNIRRLAVDPEIDSAYLLQLNEATDLFRGFDILLLSDNAGKRQDVSQLIARKLES